MTFSGVVSRNTSPTASLPSAVTSLNATGTTLGAPLAQVASVCPVCQEALSDEESAEAPPAAEEARRFRGSVLAAGRGSGWEPADTTVSAEEHAKKSPPKWVVIYVITHRFCCSHPRISQGRGSVRGKPLRVSPLAFNHPPAGDRFCAAKSPLQKKRPPKGWSFFLQRTVKIDIFGFGVKGSTAYKIEPSYWMPASCAGLIFSSGKSFRHHTLSLSIKYETTSTYCFKRDLRNMRFPAR